MISSQSNKSLLGSIGLNESVDLGNLDVVKLLDSKLDLVLVGLTVDLEDEGVSILNLLDGTLAVDVADNYLVLIKTGEVCNALSGILWATGKSLGLGEMEVGRGSDLDSLLVVSTLENGLLGVESLLLLS